MSIAERIELMETIWESLLATPEAIPVTEGQKATLSERLDALEKAPAPKCRRFTEYLDQRPTGGR